MRPVLVTIIGRCLGVLAGLLLVGIVMRLTELVLRPVLMNALDQGWSTLITTLSPALGPIATILILAGLGWAVASRRR